MSAATAYEVEQQPVTARARVEIITGGANRGARQMQPAIEKFNRASNRFTLSPIYADPVPERANQLVRLANARGIPARAVEATLQEVLPMADMKNKPLIISVDNADAIASALNVINFAERPVLIYFLVKMPSDELLGIRAVLQEDNEHQREMIARFFRTLGKVTARSGASAVLGADGRPEHVLLEGRYRSWFAKHMHANVTKIISHTRPESDPIEVTNDGDTTMTLMLKDAPTGWADPSDLARDIVGQPVSPITRGRDFMVCEVGPDAIRLLPVRLRATDGKPGIQAAAVVDAEAYRTADAERRERARRELLQAVERAARQTISRSRPIFTTD